MMSEIEKEFDDIEYDEQKYFNGKRKCKECGVNRFIKTIDPTCLQCRQNRLKQMTLESLKGSVNYPNINSFNGMNKYLGI